MKNKKQETGDLNKILAKGLEGLEESLKNSISHFEESHESINGKKVSSDLVRKAVIDMGFACDGLSASCVALRIMITRIEYIKGSFFEVLSALDPYPLFTCECDEPLCLMCEYIRHRNDSSGDNNSGGDTAEA